MYVSYVCIQYIFQFLMHACMYVCMTGEGSAYVTVRAYRAYEA